MHLVGGFTNHVMLLALSKNLHLQVRIVVF